MTTQQKGLLEALRAEGWELASTEELNEWWADDVWLMQSLWSPTDSRFYLTFLVDPETNLHRRRAKGEAVWAVKASATSPTGRQKSEGALLFSLGGGWADRLSGLFQIYQDSGENDERHVAMPTTKKQVEDAFWSGEIGFVCDSRFTDAQLPGASAVSESEYHKVLASSERLPELGGAPVASWVLARVARLATRRFPYEYGQVLGSDGGDFWLRFIAFRAELRPLGTLMLLGGENSVRLWAEISPANDSQRVVAAFTECLLSGASELRRSQVTVAYTDFTDPNHRKKLPFVFGWDGERFIGRHAPEHAASPEDFES